MSVRHGPRYPHDCRLASWQGMMTTTATASLRGACCSRYMHQLTDPPPPHYLTTPPPHHPTGLPAYRPADPTTRRATDPRTHRPPTYQRNNPPTNPPTNLKVVSIGSWLIGAFHAAHPPRPPPLARPLHSLAHSSTHRLAHCYRDSPRPPSSPPSNGGVTRLVLPLRKSLAHGPTELS